MRNPHKAHSVGFSLIEILIVVAIIGVLAAVAVPYYLEYTTRAKLTEVITMAGKDKSALAKHYLNNGAWPRFSFHVQLGDCGSNAHTKFGVNLCPERSEYISDIFTLSLRTDAMMHAYRVTNLNSDANGRWLVFEGQGNEGAVNWTCDPDEFVTLNLPDPFLVQGMYVPSTCY